METGQKTDQMMIQEAEDFGLFFNCLTRRYLRDYDKELLELILRIMDRYLAFFSVRTLICSIRDLANGQDSVFCECQEEKPKEQEDQYRDVLMRLVRRYLTIDLQGATDERRKSMRIHALASDGEFSGYYRPKEKWMFPSVDAFEAWIRDNGLDKSDGMPVPSQTVDELPIRADFSDDFCDLCVACVQYSYGRTSYMPAVCRDFIWKNIALLPTEGIGWIADEIESRIEKYPFYNDYSGRAETAAWSAYSRELRRIIM